MTFYLFLFVPFAFFLQSIFLRSKDPRRGMLIRTLILALCLALSYFIRRDIDIALYFKFFLYGFVGLLIISTPVGSWLLTPFRKFERWIKTYFDNPSRFEINVSRLSAIASAFSLGLSNTNRRKLQTIFTCITLVLLSFSVLSFTSITSMTIYKRTDVGKIRTDYLGREGLILRSEVNSSLPPESYSTFLSIADSFGLKDLCAARGLYRTINEDFLDYDLLQNIEEINGMYKGRPFQVNAILGLTPDEVMISNVENALTSGEWFKENDMDVAIIPLDLANTLGITANDLSRATITIDQGIRVTVIGIIDTNRLNTMVDMDGKPFIEPELLVYNGFVTIDTYGNKGDFIILPYEKTIEMGGLPTALLLRSDGKTDIISVLEKVVEKFPYLIYLLMDGRIYQYSPSRTIAAEGIENLPVLMIVVGLVVLNTMLSAVHQRRDEIFIYGSVGLSPMHIGGLFVAEAMVYAILGCTSGYLFGGIAAMIISRYQLVPGLVLDYSSLATMRSVILIIGLVLVSTIYPAVVASRLSVPNIERRWRFPRTFNSNLTLTLPFIFSGQEPIGALAFIKRVFENMGEKDSACGYAYESSTRTEKTRSGKVYILYLKMHLAPYDLGVNQQVEISMVPTNVAGIYHLQVELIRLTGDIPSWSRGNQAFIPVLRKQCLVWRSLQQNIRSEHEELGKKLFPDFYSDDRIVKETECSLLRPHGSRA